MQTLPSTGDAAIIDSHAHVVREYFKEDQQEVIDRARSNSVSSLVNPAVVVDDIPELTELTAAYDWIFVAAGQHPHEARHWSAESGDRIREALASPRFVAIGECGLDFHYNNSDHQSQVTAFAEQIEIARATGKPLIVHCRDAWKEAIELIGSVGKGEVRGVFHCFTGSPEIMPEVEKLDFFLSYSGIVTFPNAGDIQATAPMVRKERFLVETDCPFLAPQKMRGKRNEPSYVWWVAEKLAQLRGCALEEIAECSSRNAQELFGLPL